MDMDPATQRQRQKQAPRTGLSWPWCAGLLCHGKSPRPQGLWPGGMMWMMMWLLPYYMRIRKPDNCHAEILMHWNIIIGKCAIVVWFPFTCAHTLTVSVFVCMYICMCVCECVFHCVFASQCAQPVRQPLSIDYVWCSAAACGCHHSTLPCPAHTCSTFPYRYLCHINNLCKQNDITVAILYTDTGYIFANTHTCAGSIGDEAKGRILNLPHAGIAHTIGKRSNVCECVCLSSVRICS